MGKRIIIWDTNALHHFITILNHIKSESASNATKVKGRIDKIIKALPSNPKMFRKDEFKKKMTVVTEFSIKIILEFPIKLNRNQF